MAEVIETTKLKFCLYARRSTESDERQIMSIDSQVNEMLQIAERESLDVVAIKRESKSAKDSNNRPIFKELLDDIKQEKFNAILSWAPDRISRNAGDLGSVVDLMDEKKLLKERFKVAVSSAVKVISEQLDLEVKCGNNINKKKETFSHPYLWSIIHQLAE